MERRIGRLRQNLALDLDRSRLALTMKMMMFVVGHVVGNVWARQSAFIKHILIRACGRNPCYAFLTDSRIDFCSNHCVTGVREPDMLTGMTERDWLTVLEVFDAAQSSRGEPGHDDRKFLEAIHYFTVHSITWRALPRDYGKWNSVWKRFWRLSRSGVFEAFFQMLAECSQTAHLIQFFDSTTARAHVSAAGAKGGSSTSRSAARVAASRPKSTSRPISTATLSTST